VFFHRLAHIAHVDMGIDFSAADIVMVGQQSSVKVHSLPTSCRKAIQNTSASEFKSAGAETLLAPGPDLYSILKTFTAW